MRKRNECHWMARCLKHNRKKIPQCKKKQCARKNILAILRFLSTYVRQGFQPLASTLFMVIHFKYIIPQRHSDPFN